MRWAHRDVSLDQAKFFTPKTPWRIMTDFCRFDERLKVSLHPLVVPPGNVGSETDKERQCRWQYQTIRLQSARTADHVVRGIGSQETLQSHVAGSRKRTPVLLREDRNRNC
jgi:hypothetical protein